jgi:hypothetical protein
MDQCFESCADAFGAMGRGKRCCLLSFCLGFVAVIVYIAVAIEGVEPTEYAIVRNNLSQNIDSEVKGSGLHWVGLFNSLIHYPSIHKSIEFSDDAAAQQRQLSTRTEEGLELKVHFALQYQLQKDNLPKMYRLLQNDYEAILTRIARNSVLRVASDYKAPDYWLKRGEIGTNMFAALQADLAQAYADVTAFMLLKIDLPDVYEGAIVATEVTNQEKITFETLRVVELTKQETENIKATAFANITKINAEAAGNASYILATLDNTILSQTVNYTTQILKELDDKLTFSDKKNALSEFFQYWQIDHLKGDSAYMIYSSNPNKPANSSALDLLLNLPADPSSGNSIIRAKPLN